jgi:hypothetical protein
VVRLGHGGKPGRGAVWVQSVPDADKHGHVLAVSDASQLWFKERTPTDTWSAWKALGGPPVEPAEIADPVPNNAWLSLQVWAGVHADGRIELDGTANDIGDSRDVFYRARPPGSTAWGAWPPSGTTASTASSWPLSPGTAGWRSSPPPMSSRA